MVEARDALLADPKFSTLLDRFTDGDAKHAWDLMSGVKTVEDMHIAIDTYTEIILANSCDDEIEVEGIANLKGLKESGFLLVSNHKTHVADSLFISYALMKNGFDRLYSVSGSNLLEADYIRHILRSYNCFFLPDAANGLSRSTPRALSRYIAKERRQGHSVWIAQRIGPGEDETDVKVIKMLTLANRDRPIDKRLSFSDWLKRMNIVPVCISYEILACDWALARALDGSYTESSAEVERNVVDGLAGYKGHIDIEFGKPLGEGILNPRAAAARIREDIKSMRHFWPIRYAALDWINGNSANDDKYSAADMDKLLARVQGYEPDFGKKICRVYAESLLN